MSANCQGSAGRLRLFRKSCCPCAAQDGAPGSGFVESARKDGARRSEPIACDGKQRSGGHADARGRDALLAVSAVAACLGWKRPIRKGIVDQTRRIGDSMSTGRGRRREWIIVGVIAAALAAGGILRARWVPGGSGGRQRFEKVSLKVAPEMAPVSLGQFHDGFASVIDPVLPAVVNISSTKVVKRPNV